MPGFVRRVLVVEDDVFLGSLIVGALANEGFETSLAVSSLDAKDKLKKFDPDVAFVDIDLGAGPSGIDFIHMLNHSHPEVAAILLSKHADATSAGIPEGRIPERVGYLRKSMVHDTSALIAAIEEVARGSTRNLRQDKQSKGELDLLTKTQREILHMMAMGLSNKEIAKQRDVSLSSIEQRISEIFKAFGLNNNESVVPRVEAVRRYYVATGLPKSTTNKK